MKIALVHDWLNQKVGGGEAVLETLAGLYPEAPIYTLIYNPERFNYPAARIQTSFLQRAPALLKSRSRYLLPLVPAAIEAWDFTGFDVVISSSCAFAKNIVTDENTVHISYCHAPMRFAWDYWPAYLDEQRIGPLRRAYVRQQVKQLRLWDYAGAARVDHFIANSQLTAARIRKYYRRPSTVIYPAVALADIPPAAKQDYYVTVSMLTPYKKIDLAIEAFNVSGKKLRIIGDGPDRQRLEQLAASNIEFLGRLEGQAKDSCLAAAQALINPNEEDFGIAMVEAMAAGTPVIAWARGGATETVIEGKTGLFFHEQSVAAINKALQRFDTLKFDQRQLRKQASRFDADTFRHKITDLADKAYREQTKAR